MYRNIFDSLTVDQQQALLRGRVHLPGNPSHNLRASADGPGRGIMTEEGNIIETRAVARIIPMRQTIKLYNKAIEAIKGEAFDGKYLYSWLARVHDKARAFSWLPILTINGKLLTKNYAEISMDEVKRHAQLYQNEARRGAQNAEQLLTCLQASISRTVYNRVHQLEKKYTIRREPEREDIKESKTTHYKDTRKAYMEAKAALLAMTINSESEVDDDSNDEASHKSQDTIYMEDSDSNQL
jgi:hypothetical protein